MLNGFAINYAFLNVDQVSSARDFGSVAQIVHPSKSGSLTFVSFASK